MSSERVRQLVNGIVKQDAVEPAVDETNVQFMLTAAEKFLTMSENELIPYARAHGYDTMLPIPQLQEEVFTKTVAGIERYYGGYSPEMVAMLKRLFIKLISTMHFMGITCQRMGINRKLVLSWLKSDLEFAEKVHEAQALMSEKVGITLLSEGLHKKDTASLMFLIKQFGDVFQKPIQENFDEMTEAVKPLGDISKLSLEEQQLLLHLLRKSKSGISNVPPPQPTVFDESDPDEPVSEETPAVQEPVLYNAIPHSCHVLDNIPIDDPR